MDFDWYRATDMMDKVHIIQNGIEPEDIFQGSLGDCYFLSSISALAEHPSRIKRLLLTSKASDSQSYAVVLNICGNWEVVYLDDHFPVLGNKIAFCHTKSAEIWSMLLEKAYAKVYGGYWNIGTGGFAEDALKDLTGAPTEYVSLEDKIDSEDLWRRIRYWDDKKYVIVTGSRGDDGVKISVGIIQGHAYTIINAHEINGERVLEMRNPWGDMNEWNGRWGDDSEAWTPVLRKRYKIKEATPDGRFFMPFEDYLDYFDHISVCYYEDDYILSSFTENLESQFLACYRFDAKEIGNYYVSLSQSDSREFEYDDGERKIICLF